MSYSRFFCRYNKNIIQEELEKEALQAWEKYKKKNMTTDRICGGCNDKCPCRCMKKEFMKQYMSHKE